MSYAAVYRWHDGELVPIDYCDPSEYTVEVADSWLVSDGGAFALGLHKARFAHGASLRGFPDLDIEPFWNAAIEAIPREGDWFPRVELRSRDGAPSFLFRQRAAPELTRSLTAATHTGDDPRGAPTIKGPDLAAMIHLRSRARERGADEPVLAPDGYVVEGATTSIVWWRGDILCAPPDEFDRVDSVTARTLFGLASALGVETYREAVTPAELDGAEVWALNALQGIRIVTDWVDGPRLAEEPGRLALWRSRRQALRKPLEGHRDE